MNKQDMGDLAHLVQALLELSHKAMPIWVVLILSKINSTLASID